MPCQSKKPSTTIEEAKAYISSCKADQIIGYTNLNKIDHEITRDWLESAEKTDHGVVISEQSKDNYVFLSKEQTQPVAEHTRKVRDACLEKTDDPMSIKVDDWYEVLATNGKWIKVNR